ncbi:hypothetical protein LTR66_008486 [Elasticomyces elasticus]|nr:hypothetical protein LTR66_008486 [Elasticomyces elasticus]
MAARNSAARPKRAGEDFARNHQSLSEPSSKRIRFDYRNPSTLAPDAPEEDAILELDEIGKSGIQIKRNAVNLDGYDSDSSNENFDARADAKAKAAIQEERDRKRSGGANGNKGNGKDEDEDDMFADIGEEEFADGDEDEDLRRAGKIKKKRDVAFLDEEEIEGQVATSKAGGHVAVDFGKPTSSFAREHSVDSSSESGIDEERDHVGSDIDEELGAGAKKKHAPRLDAFNMKEEGEEGRFDMSGNYVRKAADPDAVHDSWMDGVSKKDIKLAREAEEKREEARKRKERADDEIVVSDLLAALIRVLEKSENSLEALQRLGKGRSKEKKKPKWQRNKGKNSEEAIDAAKAAEDPVETKRRELVEAITFAANQFLLKGESGIYGMEREVLMRRYRVETGEDWIDPHVDNEYMTGHSAEAKEWEYRWSDARDGSEHHGPYDASTMVAWRDAGYFGEGVEFRQVGTDGWSSIVDFV